MESQVVEPKPGMDVGRIVVDMHVENDGDLSMVALGHLPANEFRYLDVQALVDTGTTYVCLTTSDIARLGLRPVRTRRTRTSTGWVVHQFFSAVRITVQGRDCLIEVAEIPDGMLALLGQVPLEMLDFWIDMGNKRLVGNPEHGGEWVVDMF
jgi:predicted aspartyl protease